MNKNTSINTNSNINIHLADYANPEHGQHLVKLLNGYALDPMGGAEPLCDYSRENLVAALRERPTAFSVLAYVDGEPAGLINCFECFSTFACKPVINIHDVTVDGKFLGLGLSHKMMAEVENEARRRGACKLTLEVLPGNEVARQSYLKYGFSGYELDPQMGKAEFWEMKLK
jgi:ribosomal protein S18 acetylase RimI-like enzyme